MKGFQGLLLLLLVQTFTGWTGAQPRNSGSSEEDSQPSLLKASSLVCSRDQIEVGVTLSKLQSSGLNADTGHLSIPQCSSHSVHDGSVWYQTSRQTGVCGNVLRTNATHAVYFNSLFLYPQNNASFALPVVVPFSCAYPTTTNITLSSATTLRLEDDKGLSGVGARPTASISLFRDSGFAQRYPVGPLSLEVGSPLYVALTVDETDPSFRLVLDSCYTTGSSNPDDPTQTNLINSRCPVDRRHVSVIENGLSLQDRFSALIFPVEGDNLSVYLHCRLSLCDRRTNNCVPDCSGRAKRSLRNSAEFTQLGSVTVGPIYRKK